MSLSNLYTSRPTWLEGHTLVDVPRLRVIAAQLAKVANLPGDVTEVGVYKGGTARWIAEHAVSDFKKERQLFLFDTFKGMPPVNPAKGDLHKEGDFSDTTFEGVETFLYANDRHFLLPRIAKGLFPQETGEFVADREFCFVHLDVDIYDSVRDCLDFFGPRMVPGGVILLDDYLEPNCPGAKKAADEWAAANNQKIVPTVQSQALIQF